MDETSKVHRATTQTSNAAGTGTAAAAAAAAAAGDSGSGSGSGSSAAALPAAASDSAAAEPPLPAADSDSAGISPPSTTAMSAAATHQGAQDESAGNMAPPPAPSSKSTPAAAAAAAATAAPGPGPASGPASVPGSAAGSTLVPTRTVTERAPPPEPQTLEPAPPPAPEGSEGPVYGPASTAPSSQLNQRASAKPRRPYTITKKRETWTEEEHKKFLEALHFYHRDWKKIAAHVGTRTVFQARSHAQKYFSKVIKYGTGEYVPAPRPKKKQRVPRSKVGVASRGTHWTPADIPAGQIKEEPQLPPMYFDRLHRCDSSTEITPGAVLDSALKKKSEETMLPTITAVVEDATKAVEEQLYDIPATNTPLDLVDKTGKDLQNHMVSPDVKVLKNGQVLSTWHQVQLHKAQDIYRRAVREALYSMEIPTHVVAAPAPAPPSDAMQLAQNSTSPGPDSAPKPNPQSVGTIAQPTSGVVSENAVAVAAPGMVSANT